MGKKMICFDMDGTIADLYGVDNWLENLRAENPMPYVVAKPMWDMSQLVKVLNQLIAQDWEIRVISWLAKGSSPSYDQAVKIAKIEWLDSFNFPYQEAHIMAYGTAKASAICNVANEGAAILIDDDERVRKDWTMGDTINPTAGNLIEQLKQLLQKNKFKKSLDKSIHL